MKRGEEIAPSGKTWHVPSENAGGVFYICVCMHRETNGKLINQAGF